MHYAILKEEDNETNISNVEISLKIMRIFDNIIFYYIYIVFIIVLLLLNLLLFFCHKEITFLIIIRRFNLT